MKYPKRSQYEYAKSRYRVAIGLTTRRVYGVEAADVVDDDDVSFVVRFPTAFRPLKRPQYDTDAQNTA